MLELDPISIIASQIAALNQILDMYERKNINFIRSKTTCDNCAREHGIIKCPLVGASTTKHVAYVESPNQKNKQCSNTYKHSWMNHSNFSQSNNQGGTPRQPLYPPPKRKSSLEDTFNRFIQMINRYMQQNDLTNQSTSDSIKNLEVLMGQLTNIISKRVVSTLPNNNITNSRNSIDR